MSLAEDIVKEQRYQLYRNPNFEKVVTLLMYGFEYFISISACAALVLWIGSWITFLILLVAKLLRRMHDNPIYFVDDRGLGPGWKQNLLEDTAHAVRSSLAYIGIVVFIRILFLDKLLAG